MEALELGALDESERGCCIMFQVDKAFGSKEACRRLDEEMAFQRLETLILQVRTCRGISGTFKLGLMFCTCLRLCETCFLYNYWYYGPDKL